MMLKNKMLSIVITGILICAIIILAFPISSAKTEYGKINKPDFQLGSNKYHNETINAGDGKLTLNWEIKPSVNIKISFYIEYNENDENKRLPLKKEGDKEITLILNEATYSNKTEITEGEYTLVWKNNNLNLSDEHIIFLNYNLTYPKPDEESTGCYSSIILSSILFLAVIPAVFGIHQKNRKIK